MSIPVLQRSSVEGEIYCYRGTSESEAQTYKTWDFVIVDLFSDTHILSLTSLIQY